MGFISHSVRARVTVSQILSLHDSSNKKMNGSTVRDLEMPLFRVAFVG